MSLSNPPMILLCLLVVRAAAPCQQRELNRSISASGGTATSYCHLPKTAKAYPQLSPYKCELTLARQPLASIYIASRRSLMRHWKVRKLCSFQRRTNEHLIAKQWRVVGVSLNLQYLF